jgi:hypothetical protein
MDGFSIGLPRLASLSAYGFILKFWVTNINQYEGRDDMNRHLMYVHSRFVNEEIGFHTIGNSTSLSALGSILKDFWEPVSIGVKVVFLVDGQHNG